MEVEQHSLKEDCENDGGMEKMLMAVQGVRKVLCYIQMKN